MHPHQKLTRNAQKSKSNSTQLCCLIKQKRDYELYRTLEQYPKPFNELSFEETQ